MGAKKGGGGAATGGGVSYQARVAGWSATRILAEHDLGPAWDLPQQPEPTIPVAVWCETEEPVDDVNVLTSTGGYVLAQAKHGLAVVKKREDSDLASALDQFVRQFHLGVPVRPGDVDARRALDPARDRLVLCVDSTSSASIRQNLRVILDRLRDFGPDSPYRDPSRNQKDRETFGTVLNHLRAAWKDAKGTEASDDDLLPLLRLIRVEELDFAAGTAHDREARDILQRSVLRDPAQAELAWGELVQSCHGCIEAHSGADRAGLQELLLQRGLALQVPRSYRESVEKLRGFSDTNDALLEPFGRIQLGSREVRVSRRVTTAIAKGAEEGSLVVVGDPGAGKSAELEGLYRALKAVGRDVLLVRSNDLAGTGAGMSRSLPVAPGVLPEILANWPGTEPGYLLIDALDAVRGSTSPGGLRELLDIIFLKARRWHVIVTIRRYDLRYGSGWKSLFRGHPVGDDPEFRDPQFSAVRHINVPRFNDEELESACAQAPALGQLLESATPALRDLLRVPFNLNLAASLLSTGSSVEELSPIRAQIELLERYWERRVLDDDQRADAREAVLAVAAEEMARDRTLEVARSAVGGDPSASEPLQAVLSAHVLREWQAHPSGLPERSRLEFAHHILFDYAASRLFRGPSEELIRRLRHDPDLALSLRPSLVLLFEYLWFCRGDEERQEFWDAVLDVLEADGLPALGKIVGPSVAQQLLISREELQPLLRALREGAPTRKQAAENAVRHMAAALFAAPEDPRRPWVGGGAPPWCYLMAECSRSMSRGMAGALWDVFRQLCHRTAQMTPEQATDAGAAARRLLEYAFDAQPRDRNLVRVALESVSRTAGSDPAAAAALLRRCLDPERVQEWGYEELPTIAHELEHLIPVLPDVVEELYDVAFSYTEESEEVTPFWDSALLGMTSTRRQDYAGAHHHLVEMFPRFLEAAPLAATRALIGALEAHVGDRDERHGRVVRELEEEGLPGGSEDPTDEYAFDLGGRPARIRKDHSGVWDGVSYRFDDPHKLLDLFHAYVRAEWASGEPTAAAEQVLDLLAERNRLAALWRRLLALGAELPESLGMALRSMLWAVPVLGLLDTSSAAGDLIEVLYAQLEPDDQERVEQAILALPQWPPMRAAGPHVRDRLLGCIPIGMARTAGTRERLDELARDDGPPENVPPVRMSEFTMEEWDERESLAEQGVPVDEPIHLLLQSLESPLNDFVKAYQNATPPPDSLEVVLPAVQQLHTTLSSEETATAHPLQTMYAWGVLAETAAVITRRAELMSHPTAVNQLRDVLLEAAQHPDPEARADDEERFNEHPGWDSPAPRIDAADGLMGLARIPGGADDAVLEAIGRLSEDPVPAVRFQVACKADALVKQAEPLMWQLLEHFAEVEANCGVLDGVLAGPLSRLLHRDPYRVFQLATRIRARCPEGATGRKVRQGCADLFRCLFVGRGYRGAEGEIEAIAADPAANAEEASTILAGLRHALVVGPVDLPNLEQESIRKRAWVVLGRLLGAALTEFGNRAEPGVTLTDADREELRNMAGLVNHAATEVWVASGATQERFRQPGSAGPPTAEGENPSALEEAEERARSQRFYTEAGPVLDQFVTAATQGHVQPAHHIVQALIHLVEVDPAGVLLRVRDLVAAAARGGYQYEVLAADRVVDFVEKYLADYPHVIRKTPRCLTALREILDLFVNAGWGRAVQVTYRLAEIYR
jgi:hypothetical protein